MVEHAPDLQSESAEQAAPSAVQAGMHESTEPVAPVNMSVVVAEPVSQQRVLLMLLSSNIRSKLVADEVSQHEMSWSKGEPINIALNFSTFETSQEEISLLNKLPQNILVNIVAEDTSHDEMSWLNLHGWCGNCEAGLQANIPLKDMPLLTSQDEISWSNSELN